MRRGNGPPLLRDFSTLPIDVLESVFALLDFPSCGVMSQVCQLFNHHNNTVQLWNERLARVKESSEVFIVLEALPNDYELNLLFQDMNISEVARSRLGM
jgi:hypothetical protein